jgi:hypothetical protein
MYRLLSNGLMGEPCGDDFYQGLLTKGMDPAMARLTLREKLRRSL